ncbi:MAG TPA: hypothetical protein VII69_13915 [Candidatus Eremiobacteraceae bacterium]
MPKATLLCAVFLLMSSIGTAFADPVRPVAGPVILARSGVQSTYLWEASPYVAKLVDDKNVGDAGLRTLEGTAVSVLRDKAVSSHSKTLILRVVYTRSGAVSPVYGTLTFNGVENLATLTAARDAIIKFGAVWNEEIANGTIPHNLKVAITGKLPPPQ